MSHHARKRLMETIGFSEGIPWTLIIAHEETLLRRAGHATSINVEIWSYICSQYLTCDFSLGDLISLAYACSVYPPEVIRRVLADIRGRGVYTVPYLCGALAKEGGATIHALRTEQNIEERIARSDSFSLPPAIDGIGRAFIQIWSHLTLRRNIEKIH
jgi:hypothetical protein